MSTMITVVAMDAQAPVKVENRLMRVRITDTASDALKAKIAMIQRYADEGWADSELAAMFGQSKAWTSMLRRDVTYFFYCNACGAQVSTKTAECRQCN